MTATATGKPQWASRIVGEGDEAPDQLLANPFNFRFHPKFQQESLEGVLDEIGYIQRIIVNKRTGHLIDGHLRVTLAMRREQPTIPVLYVDLSEDEEKLALAAIDPLAAMAATDNEKLKELLEMTRSEDERVMKMLAKIREPVDRDERMADRDKVVKDEIWELREDAIFSSDNEWDLPALRDDRLGTIIPVTPWYKGSGKLPDPATPTVHVPGFGDPPEGFDLSNHVLAFWCHDDNFESVWNEAVKMVRKFKQQKWGNLVAPDFSVWGEEPLAVQLWSIYRGRWVARYWQEAGFPVIPNVSWSSDRNHQFVIAGIPKKAPVVGMHTLTAAGERISFARGFARSLEALEPQNVIIYGDLAHRNWLEPALPTGPMYHWVASRTAMRKEHLDRARAEKHRQSG